MHILSTRTHGIIDYLMGLVLIVAPYLLGFATGGPEQWVPMTLGIAMIVYSLATDYEFGVARVLPMPAHLVLDGLAGLLLAASPWLFGFADRVYWPHLILGLLELGTSVMTDPRSRRDAARSPVGRHHGRVA
jgi:hypothetical protein